MLHIRIHHGLFLAELGLGGGGGLLRGGGLRLGGGGIGGRLLVVAAGGQAESRHGQSGRGYRARRSHMVHSGHQFRSEENTYELQSLMRISYAVFCLKKTTTYYHTYVRTLPRTHPTPSEPTN